jgi:hypothetical protein
MYRDQNTDREIMRFGFYSKNDRNREVIHSGVFQSSHDAAAVFAAMKGLNINVFLDLFTITIVSGGKF